MYIIINYIVNNFDFNKLKLLFKIKISTKMPKNSGFVAVKSISLYAYL